MYHYVTLLALWLQWKHLRQLRYRTRWPQRYQHDAYASDFHLSFSMTDLGKHTPFRAFSAAHVLIGLKVCRGIKLINLTAQNSDNHIPWFLKKSRGAWPKCFKVWFNVTFLCTFDFLKHRGFILPFCFFCFFFNDLVSLFMFLWHPFTSIFNQTPVVCVALSLYRTHYL